MDSTQIMVIIAIISIFVGLIINFIPTIIAFKRDVASRWAIFFINLFFGWTIIVWIITLIWACEGRIEK